MADERPRVDWTALCNHPGIIFGQRMVLVVATALCVPLLIWAGSQFVLMRDTSLRTVDVLERVEKRQADFESRIRVLEHRRSRPWGEP